MRLWFEPRWFLLRLASLASFRLLCLEEVFIDVSEDFLVFGGKEKSRNLNVVTFCQVSQ